MSILSHGQLVNALLRADPVPAQGPATKDPRLDRGLTVHRDTVRHALVDALRETFPGVRIAVGTAYFDALAIAFIEAHPPRSPVLQEYGGAFAVFLAVFPPLQDWPWLTDLARIDWARREAFHAADAEPLPLSRLRFIDSGRLLAAKFSLHPSLRLLESRHPMASLWFAHRDVDDETVDENEAVEPIEPREVAWHPEACQVWRIGERVHVRRVSGQALATLHALNEGRSLMQALWAAFGVEIDHASIEDVLHHLLADRLVIAIHPDETE